MAASRTASAPKKAAKKGPVRSDAWRDAFLAILAETCNVSYSAKMAKVSRRHVYETRNADAGFAAAWDDAVEQGVDGLEMEARRRAMDSSDTLAIFLLKAHRPQKYRENASVDVTSGGKPIEGWVLREVTVNKPESAEDG